MAKKQEAGVCTFAFSMFGYAVNIKIKIYDLSHHVPFLRLSTIAQRQADISTVPKPRGVLCCHLFSNQLMGRPCTITCSLRTFALLPEHQVLQDEWQKWDNRYSGELQMSFLLRNFSKISQFVSLIVVALRGNTIDRGFSQLPRKKLSNHLTLLLRSSLDRYRNPVHCGGYQSAGCS